ncbi:VanZ like family protein [Anatilimnocola aggregata]|uniref:VanZ like family protein n=2 Tax=Anatilimnocola aggregata TaxID=2528021 RepID=A0A517Y4L2_9BACT|nr:VanZ like family protein [Anatilimnocola aggregata]
MAAAYWALIFTLTHVPLSFPGPVGSLDKLQHGSAFFGLAVLLCSAYGAWRPHDTLGYIWVFIAIAAYGAIDEITQGFVPYRYPDFFDWLADVGGAAVGVGLMFLVAAFWPARAAAAAAVASADVKTR